MLRSRVGLMARSLDIILGLFGVTAVHGIAASLVFDRDVSTTSNLSNQQLPVWAWGGMVGIQANHTTAPALSQFDENCTLLDAVTVRIPDAYRVDASDFTRGRDGTLALCGWTPDAQGRLAGFVAVAQPSHPLRIIRTNPFFPRNIAVA